MFWSFSKTFSPIGLVAAYKGLSKKDAFEEISRRYDLQNVSGKELLEAEKRKVLEKFVENGKANLTQHKATLGDRGITEELIGEGNFGYYSDNLIAGKESEEELLELGILSKVSEESIATNFSLKIIIPLYKDHQLITVLAWNYSGLENEPKYLLFPSGSDRPLIGDMKSGAIVVEGYFDMRSLQMSGYDAMSDSRAIVTQAQVKELGKFNDLKLMFDGDTAGYEAGEKIRPTRARNSAKRSRLRAKSGATSSRRAHLPAGFGKFRLGLVEKALHGGVGLRAPGPSIRTRVVQRTSDPGWTSPVA